MKKTPILLVAAVLLAGLPLAAAAGDGAEPEGEKTVEKKVEKQHRWVVATPGDAGQEMTLDPDAKVRVMVMADDDEGDGEPEIRTFVWKGEDGEVTRFEPGAMGFFSAGAERGFLGVQLLDLTSELRLHYGTREDRGVLVSRVVDDSPAQRAGLRVGDVITHLDGEPVTSSFDATTRIGTRGDGEVVALEVMRDGKVETLSATLETRERPQIEVGSLLHHLGEEGGGFSYTFDPEALEKKMEGVRTYFESPEWEAELERIHEDVEKELRDLDVKIRKLEKDLEVEVEIEEETDDEP